MKCHALFASVLLLAAVADARAAEAAVARASTEQVRQRVLELVNQARSTGRRCGAERYPSVAPLAWAPPLESAAQSHARDMATREYFAHRGHDGREPRDRVRDAGYTARLAGENIAFGAESAEEAVAGWLASPGHCANIMDGRFRHTGVAFSTARQPGHIYWVQTFGAPR